MSEQKRLELTEIRFCGRDVELQQLYDAYQSAKDKDSTAEPVRVVISGYSGTGKSTLVLRSLGYCVKKFGGYFCSGKFDQCPSTRPYSAIVDVFTQLCQLLDENIHGSVLQEALEDDELAVLINVIPAFRLLLPNCLTEKNNTEHWSRLEWGFNRFKLLLRKVFGAVCNPFEPIVLFIDDLQWSDLASLDLIKDFISELHVKGLVLVLSYRDNEVNDQHPLATKILGHLEDCKCPTVRLHISNLSLPSVQQLVSSLLCLDEEAIDSLAKIVFEKTHGNVFFVVQFLKSLEERGLLHYERLSFRWKWDLDRIRSDTNVSENVVDLVSERIERLSGQLKTMLTVGACLSQHLDLNALFYILSNGDFQDFPQTTPELTNGDIKELLDKAVEENLVHYVSGTRYRFSHDRIQQAAYSLLPEGMERVHLHKKNGRLLYQLYQTEECEEWIFLVAVDQLNRGASLFETSDERVEIARLNLESARKVSAKSAFFPAAQYLSDGIEFLGDSDDNCNTTKWEENYDLCLAIHNFALDMEFCCGNFQRCREMVDTVVANSRSLTGKLPAYFRSIEMFTSQKQFNESISMGREVLIQLGIPWPKKTTPFHVLMESHKLKRILNRVTDDDFRSLPIMDDETKVATVKVMMLHVTSVWWLGDQLQFALLCLRMLRFTITEGLSEYSGVIFGYYSLFCVASKDVESGFRFADLAVWANGKFDCKHEARMIPPLYCAAVHLKQPLTYIMEKSLHGYQCGLKTGDIEFGLIGAANYLALRFHCGLPLASYVEDAEGYHAQMIEYKQEMVIVECLAHCQCALNLMGRSKDPRKLKGELLDVDTVSSQATQFQATSLMSLQLALYFHDWKQLQHYAKVLGREKGMGWPAYWSPIQVFYLALANYSLAVETGKRVYKKRALCCTKTLGRWVKWGMSSVFHLLSVLKAEKEALKGNINHTKKAYDDAIRIVARSGFTHIEAITNERIGQIYLRSGDCDWAAYYLLRAKLLYKDWGAIAKVDHMDITYKQCLAEEEGRQSSASSSLFGTFIKGTAKFSHSSADMHKNHDLVGLGTAKL